MHMIRAGNFKSAATTHFSHVGSSPQFNNPFDPPIGHIEAHGGDTFGTGSNPILNRTFYGDNEFHITSGSEVNESEFGFKLIHS